MLCVFSPNTTLNRQFFCHRSQEFIYVLKGEMSVTVEGVEERLDSGDSLYLKDNIPAEWKNEGGDEVQLLVVC